MNATHCYILVQITSYSFEVQGASLDESRADHWREENPNIRQICDVRLLEDLMKED